MLKTERARIDSIYTTVYRCLEPYPEGLHAFLFASEAHRLSFVKQLLQFCSRCPAPRGGKIFGQKFQSYHEGGISQFREAITGIEASMGW